jgi:hypothetical protein
MKSVVAIYVRTQKKASIMTLLQIRFRIMYRQTNGGLMKTATLLLTGMLSVYVGCSTMRQVDSDQKEKWLSHAQDDLLGRDATVVTRDGLGAEGQIILLNSDSLRVLEEKGGSVRAFEMNQVSLIRQPRNAWPAVGGFLIGFLVGGLLGGAIGTDEAVHADNVDEGVSAFVWSPIIGGVVGGVVGSTILGLATSVTDYRIIYKR